MDKPECSFRFASVCACVALVASALAACATDAPAPAPRAPESVPAVAVRADDTAPQRVDAAERRARFLAAAEALRARHRGAEYDDARARLKREMLLPATQ